MTKEILKENLCLSVILLLLLAVNFYDIIFLDKTFKVTTAGPQAMPTGVWGQDENRPPYFPLKSTDSSTLEEPILEFIKKSLHQGILPLWNPHQGCGFPLIAMLEVGIFFPLNAFYYLFPSAVGWDLLILARFFLAGFFMYWFMRTLRYGSFPSLVSAVVFMFSGPMVLLQYWFVHVEILAPLVLLVLERLLRQPNRANSCLLALATAATFFAGHPEHILFVHSFGFLFLCFRIISLKLWTTLKKIFLYLLMGYGLGVGMSMVVFLPFASNFKSAFWHDHYPFTGLYADGHWKDIITLLVPHFFQRAAVGPNFENFGWWGGYMGFLPFALGLVSLLSCQRKGLNDFFALLAFLNIAKSFFSFPFINWIGYLPLFSDCRFYFHTAHLFALSLAVLAGMGARRILSRKNTLPESIGIVFTLLGIVAFYAWQAREKNFADMAFASSALATQWGALFLFIQYLKMKKYLVRLFPLVLGLVIVSELFLYIPREWVKRLDSFPSTPYIEWLKRSPQRARAYGIGWVFYPNTASGYEVDDLGIAFGLLPVRFVHFINHLVIENFKKDLQHSSFRSIPVTFLPQAKGSLDLLNVKYTIVPPKLANITRAHQAIGPPPVYSREVDIYENPDVLPRAFIVHKILFEPEEQLSLQKIREIQKAFPVMAVIQHSPIPEIENLLSPLRLIDNSKAEIVRYTPNEVVIKVKMENPGFLVLTDGYHPDWMALVNGKRTPLYITNYLFRSVFLPTGEHVVRFIFQPLSFYLGMIFSLAFLLATVVLWKRK